MEQVVQREFKVLGEAISPPHTNVQAMAELITALEMKHLIAFVGAPMITMRNKLYREWWHCTYASIWANTLRTL